MKSSKPDISAPLSKTKKQRTLFTLNVVIFLAVLLGLSLAFPGSHRTPEANLLESSAAVMTKQEQPADPIASKQEPRQLKLITKHGAIKIALRPDLSPESVQHLNDFVAKDQCDECQFYRSEKGLLLQGIMKNNEDDLERPSKGPCPPEFSDRKQNCPKHDDPKCACHGPTMTMGMVGWAGGEVGPDFFINVFHKPVDEWGQEHTVWGMVEDPESLDLILHQILELPVQDQEGMNMLEQPIEFQLSME